MAHRLTLLAACVVLALTAPPTYAATGSPPVTHSDTVRMHAAEGAQFDLAANDTDPDGDDLAVCRLGDDLPGKLEVSLAEGQLQVIAGRRATGTYTFTYYACDSTYLTPGQVTVKVDPPMPTLDVIPLGELPGRMKIVNGFKQRTFHCEWWAGEADEDEKSDGRATVRPRSTVVFTVREVPVLVMCDSANSGYVFLFDGRLSGPAATTRYSAKASGGGQAQTRLRSP